MKHFYWTGASRVDSAASQKEQENLPSEKEVDSFGKTPLHIACTYGQLSMVEKLLKVIIPTFGENLPAGCMHVHDMTLYIYTLYTHNYINY